MLQFKVSDLGPEGLDLDISIPTEALDTVKEKFIQFTEPFHLTGDLKKISDKIVGNASLTSAFKGECGRCLEIVNGQWSQNFTFVVDIDRKTEFFDITDALKEEVLLNLPERLVCKEECKGLCPSCGQNLNQKKCSCDQTEFHDHAENKEDTYQPFKNLKIKK